jgi:phosphopantothenoylcysteine synthetase/decarboxylase
MLIEVKMMRPEKLLIGVTGAIGTLTVPSYLHAIREKFSAIKIITTEAAESFIPKKSLSLIVDDVHSSLFPSSKGDMTHVQLARWADLFIVLPATAHVIAQAAHGLAGSLLTLAILAHGNPVLFFPNMNKYMWENRATQRNVNMLREDGHHIISPIDRISYEHSSGERNTGKHLPTPSEIINILESELEKRKMPIETNLLNRVLNNNLEYAQP